MTRARRTTGLALVALSVWCAACGCANPTADSGPTDDGRDRDGGVDAGVFRDGGQIETAGACYDSPAGRKFILYFRGAGLCSEVSFRRFDGGFQPLFSDATTAPENYLIDDARVGLCSMVFEQADGQLNQNAARIDSFHGVIGWAGYQAGRPWGYSANGTMAFFGTEFWFSTPPGGDGLIDPCLEP